jgi:hypothetical protein
MSTLCNCFIWSENGIAIWVVSEKLSSAPITNLYFDFGTQRAKESGRDLCAMGTRDKGADSMSRLLSVEEDSLSDDLFSDPDPFSSFLVSLNIVDRDQLAEGLKNTKLYHMISTLGYFEVPLLRSCPLVCHESNSRRRFH